MNLVSDLQWFCTFLKKKEKIPFFVPPLFLDDYAIDSGVRRPIGKVFRRTFDSCTILVEWMVPKPLKIEITHHLVISTISKIVPVVWCGRWERAECFAGSSEGIDLKKKVVQLYRCRIRSPIQWCKNEIASSSQQFARSKRVKWKNGIFFFFFLKRISRFIFAHSIVRIQILVTEQKIGQV